MVLKNSLCAPAPLREKTKFQQQAATSPGYRRRRAVTFAQLMIKIDDIEFEEDNGARAPRLFIWLDASPYAKNEPPSLSINIAGRARECTLHGQRQRLAPALYATTKFVGTNWRELSGLELSDDSPDGTQFTAWCMQPDDTDIQAYNLRLISSRGSVFTLECHSELCMCGDEPDGIAGRLYVLCDVPLRHLGIGMPRTSTDPLGDAAQLVKRWFDPSAWGRGVLHERRLSTDGPVVAYEVLYDPE